MYNKSLPHISSAKYEGRFIAVKQIQREIFVVFVPKAEPGVQTTRKIYVLVLDELLFITNAIDISLPYFTDIRIKKIYTQVSADPDFIISGVITTSANGVKGYADFKAKNYTHVALTNSSAAAFKSTVFDVAIKDVAITSVSKKGDIAHIVGTREQLDEVYIQYDCDKKTIVQELGLFSPEGYFTLSEVYCNPANEVFIVGHFSTDDNIDFAYFNRLLSTSVG